MAEIPFDQDTLKVLGVTDYLNRVYFSPTAGRAGTVYRLLPYPAYRSDDSLAQELPSRCGMAADGVETYQLSLDDGRKVPVNLYVIRKDLDQEIVLYWYQSHGRVVASEYWGKFYMVYDAMRLNRTDAALVRITAPVRNGDTGCGARRRQLRLPNKLQWMLSRLFPGDPGEFMRNRYFSCCCNGADGRSACRCNRMQGQSGKGQEEIPGKRPELCRQEAVRRGRDPVQEGAAGRSRSMRRPTTNWDWPICTSQQHERRVPGAAWQPVELDPKNLKARLEMGNILWSAKEFKRAEDQGPQGHGSGPQQRRRLHVAGYAAVCAEGRLDEAMQSLQQGHRAQAERLRRVLESWRAVHQHEEGRGGGSRLSEGHQP